MSPTEIPPRPDAGREPPGAPARGAGDVVPGGERAGVPGGAPRRAWGWRAAAAVALVVHLVVLYAPSAPDTGGVPLPPWTDLVVHVAVFAALAFTALRARLPLPHAAMLAVLAVHAPISELVQHLALADRTGDPRDVAADLAGVALGWALARLTTRRRP